MVARKVSDKDLRSLRDRMKIALRKAGKTGRDAEVAAGLSKGSLTRIYGGRKKVEFSTIVALADFVGSTPTELLTKGAQKVFAEELAQWAPAPEASPAAEVSPEPEITSEPVVTPAPEAAPEPEAAPTPEAASAPEPPPYRPDPPPRKRKRDLPVRVARRLLRLVRGVVGL